jgi:hypothetical protein
MSLKHIIYCEAYKLVKANTIMSLKFLNVDEIINCEIQLLLGHSSIKTPGNKRKFKA